MSDTPLRDAALEYAARGWQVLPLHGIERGSCTCGKKDCQSPGKHPRTSHGLKDASSDPETVSEWWQRWPEANIGVRTGEDSGLFVLDVDSQEAAEGLKGKIPPDAVVQSTGRGYQVLFKHPGFTVKNSTSEIGPDIDVRGDGGYIVAPPSIHANGKRYTWKTEGEPQEAPEWLLDLLRNGKRAGRQPAPEPAPTACITDERTRAYVAAAIQDEHAIVRAAQEGSRNATLNAAAFALGTLAHLGADEADSETALVSAAIVAGLPQDEARRTFRSGWSAGAQEPREMPERATVASLRDGRPEATPATGPSAPANRPEAEPRFRTAPELASVLAEHATYAVDSYLAFGAITEIGAKIKTGKTAFDCAMTRCLLTGEPFIGRKVERCSVLYLTEERAPSFRAALARVGIQDAADLHILLRQEAGRGNWSEITASATEYALQVGARVLIVDTLSDWAGIAGEQENSAGAALEAVRPLQQAAAAGLAVMVNRHERKSGGEIGDSARGSSAFGGAVDILLSLRRMTSPGHENRRELVAVGRFDDIPPKVVIEYEEGEYRLLGDRDELERQEARRHVLDLLPALPEDARTFDSLLEDCGEGTTRTTLHRALSELLNDGQVRREKGAGSAGPRSYGYWLSEGARI